MELQEVEIQVVVVLLQLFEQYHPQEAEVDQVTLKIRLLVVQEAEVVLYLQVLLHQELQEIHLQ